MNNRSDIIHISILGYGLKVTYFGYDGENDGSLDKFGYKKNWNKYSNPSFTIYIFYRWLNFHLLLNRG